MASTGAVAYGIITDHGGTIRVHNLPGAGAEFTVMLPPCARAPGREPPALPRAKIDGESR